MARRVLIGILSVLMVAGLIVVAPPSPSAEAGTPPPAWYWQNPTPNGYTMCGLDMLTATKGWAVGTRGTILRTGDGGHTWDVQPSGVITRLNDVCFIDEHNGWAVGDGNVILTTTDAGTYWIPQTAAGTAVDLNAIRMVTDKDGWIVGDDGRVLVTHNGGTDWTVESGAGTGTLVDCDFTDLKRGWAVASDGKIYTTNGGGTWTAAGASGASWLAAVDFVTPSLGYAVGLDSSVAIVCKTTDGGSTWTPTSATVEARNVYFSDVKFVDELHGWASAGLWGQGYVLQTVDGGATWTKGVWAQKSDLFALDMTNLTDGCAVGSGGLVWGTTDGTFWSLTRSSSPGTSLTQETLYSTAFTSASEGYAVGAAGTVLSTADGGYSWSSQTIDATKWLHHVSFTATDIGWMVGESGRIYRTANGADWTQQTSNTTQHLYGVWAAPGWGATDAYVWAVGNNGTIRKTIDGGATWSTHSSGTTVRLYDVEYDNGTDTAWIVGDPATPGGMGTVLKGTGSGDIWTPITTPQTGTIWGVCAPAAAPPGKVWTFGETGIYYSGNGGTSWTQQSSQTVVDMAIYNDSGIAVGNSGKVYRTSDGGANWNEEFVGDGYLYGLAGIGDLTKAWAVGENGHILASTAAAPLGGTLSLNEGSDYSGWGSVPTTGLIRMCSYVPIATGMSYRVRHNGGLWSDPTPISYYPRYEISYDNAPGLWDYEVTYTDGVHAPLVLTDSITMDMTDPTPPILNADPLSPTSVRISWTGAADTGGSGVAAYLVRAVGSSGDLVVAYVDAALPSYTVTGLVGNTPYTFVVKAVDNAGRMSTQALTMEAPLNDPPVLAAIGNRSLPEATSLAFTATATDTDGPHALTFSLSPGAPVGASMSPGGAFSWTPTEAQGPGVYPITVNVSDGADTDSETINVTVTEVADPAVMVPVYRFYRPSTGTHFYTADAAEMARVRDTMQSTYSLDGVGYYMNTVNPANSVPLYRFYNTRTGTHLYTADENEKNNILANLSGTYSLDGIAYYVSMSGGLEVHRFYSPGKGVHFYSADPNEIANVRANLGNVWQYEGPAYYVGQ